MMPYLLKHGTSYWHTTHGWVSSPNEATQFTQKERDNQKFIPHFAEWVQLPRFNHMFGVAFEVVSFGDDGEDVTPDMLRRALLQRIINLDEDRAWLEAVGAPDDTYSVNEE